MLLASFLKVLCLTGTPVRLLGSLGIKWSEMPDLNCSFSPQMRYATITLHFRDSNPILRVTFYMKRTSKIWELSKIEFQNLLNDSSSYCEILRKIGLQGKNGNNIGTLKKRIKEEGLDTSILNQKREEARQNQLSELNFKIRKYSNEELFIENSETLPSVIRGRILKDNLLPYVCQRCKNNGNFLGKPLTLQLDHINGINNDHRLKNLRFLCPNCHSQTSTYAGKSRKKYNECSSCSHKKKTKIQWPNPEDLQKLLWEKPTSKIAKELGVSDSAVSKFARKNNLTKPPRGYWTLKLG